MPNTADPATRRTTADIVFDTLRDEIVNLDLLPGTKISEQDVARRLGVSRQPVRDAFIRLGNLDLLRIRPQRATVVRGFSMTTIRTARFVRQAVELEVVEHACAIWDSARAAVLEDNILQQSAAVDANETERFHALDYTFHALICELGGFPLAFETIKQCKRKVDRLCVLSLDKAHEMTAVLSDHQGIAEALKTGSVDQARAIVRRHLNRLDATIAEIHRTHEDYFE